MPLPLYRHALESGQRPDLGINLSVCGSSLMVANTNALQVTGNSALDPWKVVDGTATNHGNVRIIAVPNAYLYMNIWHVAPALTITTGATVRIFGRVPEPVGKDRVWPEDQDAAAEAFTVEPTLVVEHPGHLVLHQPQRRESPGAHRGQHPLDTIRGELLRETVDNGGSTRAPPLDYFLIPLRATFDDAA